MAKLHTDPITEADLLKYLATTDFQFELEVFQSLHSRGVNASHGGIYSDPITNKDRQYDIRAEINHGIATLKLAVECKNLKQHFPLLISRVPRRPRVSYHEVMLGREGSVPEEGGDPHRMRGQIFQQGEPVGKAATQVGKTLREGKTVGAEIVNSDSETYEKWSQALASANDLIAQSGHSTLKRDPVNAVVVIPILVVPTQTLWAVDYSSTGSVLKKPHQVEQCSLFLEKSVTIRYLEYTISHLFIFTKPAFDAYIHKLQDRRSDEWERLFPDDSQYRKYRAQGRIEKGVCF